MTLLSDLARVRALFQQRAIATHITGRLQPACRWCGRTHRSCECSFPGPGAVPRPDPVSALIPADGELSHPDAVAFSRAFDGVSRSGLAPLISHGETGAPLQTREDAVDNHSNLNSHGEAYV